LTAFSADCTVATQPPQVIPLMVRVTVSSFAGAVIANPRETRSAATTNPSKEIDLPAHKNHLLLGYWERIAGVILTPAVGGEWNNYESQKTCPYAFISTRCPTVGWSRLPQGAGAPGRRLRTAAACSLGKAEDTPMVKPTGYAKNIESTPRQVFQQASCHGFRTVQQVLRAVASGLRPVSTSG
jgi:hypothetical protein